VYNLEFDELTGGKARETL